MTQGDSVSSLDRSTDLSFLKSQNCQSPNSWWSCSLVCLESSWRGRVERTDKRRYYLTGDGSKNLGDKWKRFVCKRHQCNIFAPDTVITTVDLPEDSYSNSVFVGNKSGPKFRVIIRGNPSLKTVIPLHYLRVSPTWKESLRHSFQESVTEWCIIWLAQRAETDEIQCWQRVVLFG
jgi:hypothetical protein